jgi:hypothetical protein
LRLVFGAAVHTIAVVHARSAIKKHVIMVHVLS